MFRKGDSRRGCGDSFSVSNCLQGGLNFKDKRWFILALSTTNTRLFPCCPPHPKLQLPSARPTPVWLPEIQLSETGDAMGEEQPDSPELECQPFPQETWSISNEGALDRPGSAHTRTKLPTQKILRQAVGQTNEIQALNAGRFM